MTMPQQQDSGADTTRIGVDFGVSTTVIAVAVPGSGTTTFAIPGISHQYPGDPSVHAIPSLVQYAGGKLAGCGEEAAGTGPDPGTVRWMRRYLCEGSPVQIPRGDGRTVGYEEATASFLTCILARVLAAHPGAALVFAVPAGAPPTYGELLQRAARTAGARSCSLVPEYRAALPGSGCQPAAGEPVLILSVPETEPEAVIVAGEGAGAGQAAGGLRVLATATGSSGCHAIDGWIANDLILKCRLSPGGPRAVRLASTFRREAARLREELPRTREATVRLDDPVSGRSFAAVYTAADLDCILSSHNVIQSLQDCMDRALSALRMRGGDPARITHVLILGEGGLLPQVQDAVREKFPSATVHTAHPIDAIARGAAEPAFLPKKENRIACSYALRYWDPVAQEHHYRYLVHSGARYPSAGQVARIIISAAYDGQTHLGIPLCRMGHGDGDAGRTPAIELVSERGGGVRLAGPVQDADAHRQAVPANERAPTLLVANPPARKGEPRFECTFTVDAERNLCLSARDLVTGKYAKQNEPVHRLT
jgi:molecular chaperone DnaK (HSP70)